MSDTTLNEFVSQFADATARGAFTPVPPTPASGPDSGYFAFQQDDGSAWAWDSNAAAWVEITGSGGNVTAGGTLTSGQPVLGAGTTAVAVGPINLAGGASFVTGDLPFANLAQGSALSVLGVTGNATADNASIAAGSDHQVMRRSGTAVAFGAVNLAQSAAVTGILPVANGGSGIANGATLYRVVTPMTNANVIALPTTPFTLAPAPGAGLIIVPHQVIFLADFSTAAYTNFADGDYISVGNGNTEGQLSYIADDAAATLTSLTQFLAAADRITVLTPWQQSRITNGWGSVADPDDYTAQINQPLNMTAITGAATNFTGGNVANTLKAIVYYSIETI